MRASIAYTICNVITNSIGILTLPLFTRILTTDQYGQYNVYATWLTIFAIFITLNLPYGSFSKAMIEFKNDRAGYVASIQGICTLLGFVFILIYLLFYDCLSQWIKMPVILVIVMIAEIVANFVIQCWFGWQRFEYRYIRVIIVTVISALLAPTLAVILVFNTDEKGYARILGYALITITVGVVLFFYNLIKGKKLYNKEYWKYAFVFNLPLLLYYASQVIFNQSDRLMIDYYCGYSDTAKYSVAYSLGVLLNVVLNAINNSYTPWVYSRIKDGRYQNNKRITQGIALIMSALLLVVVWGAPEAILIMAGEEYREAMWAVPPVAMSVLLLFYAQVFIAIEFFYEMKVSLVIGSIVAAFTNIVLNAIFIPRFGFTIAAYTTFASYIIFAVVNYLYVKKKIGRKGVLQGFVDVKRLFVIAIAFFILAFTGMFLYSYFWARLAVILIVLVLCLAYRKKIINILKLSITNKNSI